MENAELFEYLFKLVIGICVPLGIKSLNSLNKNMQNLNVKVAILLERDATKDEDIKENKRDIERAMELIAKLQIKVEGIKND